MDVVCPPNRVTATAKFTSEEVKERRVERVGYMATDRRSGIEIKPGFGYVCGKSAFGGVSFEITNNSGEAILICANGEVSSHDQEYQDITFHGNVTSQKVEKGERHNLVVYPDLKLKDTKQPLIVIVTLCLQNAE